MVNDIHSCSYYCTRPECVKAQRDELRDKFFALAHRLTTGPTAILSAESGITLMALDDESYLKLLAMDQRRVSVFGAP
jgi:hypothetical protein